MQAFTIRNGGKENVFGLGLATSADDVLPHQILHDHTMSSIQGRQVPTNQSAPRGCHKDPRAHTGSKPTQNVIHTWNTPKGPHVSHLKEEGSQSGPQGVGQTMGSAKPP
jgi:hypothetical protein